METSTQSKHTPGPWKVLPDSHAIGGHPNHRFRFVATANWTEDDGGFSVTGEIVAKLTDAPCIAANARLIAAAPDLLAVCEEIDEHGTDDWDTRMKTLRAALAKARGR